MIPSHSQPTISLGVRSLIKDGAGVLHNEFFDVTNSNVERILRVSNVKYAAGNGKSSTDNISYTKVSDGEK